MEMTMALMKWRFVITIIKLKCGEGTDSNSSIQEILDRVLDT
jgi:hypothetical protein